MNAADVSPPPRASQVIVHAANPPGYRNWGGLVMPMTGGDPRRGRRRPARARPPRQRLQLRARLRRAIAEDAPQAPATRKGKIRVEMERCCAAPARGASKVLILRAGDFFGPAAPNSGLGWLTVRAKRPDPHGVLARPPRRRPCLRLSAGHGRDHWPACSTARTASAPSRCSISPATGWRGPTSWPPRSRRVTGHAEACRSALPLCAGPCARALRETFRELIEMRYLWQQAHRPGQRQAGRVSWARSRTPRWMRPCARRWRTWGVWARSSWSGGSGRRWRLRADSREHRFLVAPGLTRGRTGRFLIRRRRSGVASGPGSSPGRRGWKRGAWGEPLPRCGTGLKALVELELRSSPWSRTAQRAAAMRPPEAVLEQDELRSKDRLQDIKARPAERGRLTALAPHPLDTSHPPALHPRP